jgi:predicted dinucleotide-binding enzyme
LRLRRLSAAHPGEKGVKHAVRVGAAEWRQSCRRATVLLAGEDATAVAKVEALVKSAELKPIVTGPLAAARNIEAVAALNIGLGYGRGKAPTSRRLGLGSDPTRIALPA